MGITFKPIIKVSPETAVLNSLLGFLFVAAIILTFTLISFSPPTLLKGAHPL